MRKLKWFTLVEILIVIVIIGILIWALVPRMSAAQGRARDVARKNDLSNLQAAIIVNYQDNWKYPCSESTAGTGCKEFNTASGCVASSWCDIYDFKGKMESAWMNSVPKDPLSTNNFYWVWSGSSSWWNYRYITMKSHWVTDWWFALMAKTEVAGWSNWVVCMTWANKTTIQTWALTNTLDVKTLKLCTSLEYQKDNCSNDYNWHCTYSDETELRYVILY